MIYKKMYLTEQETKALWDGLSITRVFKIKRHQENMTITIKGKW